MPSTVPKKSRPRRPRPSDSDCVLAREAARELGKSYPTLFHRERQRRQLVLDAIQGLISYPEEFLRDDLDGATRAAKGTFDREHHLVVVEWGGAKPPGGSWTFSRRQCREVAEGGLLAELQARRRVGLAVVSPALGRAKSRAKAQPNARADRESTPQGSDQR